MAELPHTITQRDGTTLLAVEGEIDVSNARAMRTLLLQTLAQVESLAVDLGGVVSMDSSGIATLIEARAEAKASGKSFRVAAASERVRLAFKLLCIEQMLMGN